MQNNRNNSYNSYNSEEPYNGYPGHSSYYNDVNRFVDCEKEQRAKNNTVLIVLVAVLATVSIAVSAFALILLNSDDSEKSASTEGNKGGTGTEEVLDDSQKEEKKDIPEEPVEPVKPTITEPVKTVYVDCNTTLTLREGPGTGYNKIVSIPTGDALDFYEYADNGFARVRYNGRVGYVSAQYISDYRPEVWNYNEYEVRSFVEEVLYDYVNAINYDDPDYVGRHCIGEARDKSYANHGKVKATYQSEQVISVNTHSVKRVGKKQVTVIRESVIRTWKYDGTVRDVKEKYLTTVDYTSNGMKVSKFKAMK